MFVECFHVHYMKASSSALGHHEKPNVLAFHPQANSLLASAGYDGKLLIWNVEKKTIEITLEPLAEPVSLLTYDTKTNRL